MAKCQANNSNGKPCKRMARAGGPFCFQHDPMEESARRELSRRGGHAKHGTTPPETKKAKPKPPKRETLLLDRLAEIWSQIIIAGLNSQIDHQMLNAMTTSCYRYSQFIASRTDDTGELDPDEAAKLMKQIAELEKGVEIDVEV